MSRLEEIAAAHAHRPAEEAREKADKELRDRLEKGATLAAARKAAMKAALRVTGKVIFPGRWSAGLGWSRNYGETVECEARWEGLLLVVAVYPRSERSPRLSVLLPGAGAKSVSSEAGLASLLREVQ